VAQEVVRVALLWASTHWRDATAALLADCADLEYTGAAATTEELAQLSPLPDVLVFDAPDNDAVEGLLANGPPTMPLVMLTSSLNRETALRALRLGGVAILDREASQLDLQAAVHAAMGGLCTLSPMHLAKLTDPAESVNAALGAEWIEPLTPRELQILRMLSGGLANRAIAAQLEISEHTAKFHVGQILAKLGAETRTQAVTIGIRRGLIMI
jgi:two-component system, NarL family, response regulator YdfI